MRRPKSYQALGMAHGHGQAAEAQAEPALNRNAVFELEVDATSSRKLDFGSRLGKGFDSWVWAGLDALHMFARSGAITRRTILNYAGAGWPRWLDYLVATHGPADPKGLRPEHVKSFVEWLKHKYPFRTSAHSTYAQVKPMLVAICDIGLGPARSEDLFPIKAFANRIGQRQSPTALTQAEILRLAHALKMDLIAIHRSEFTGPDSEALTVSFLVIALRTGINTTPLLEAARDCLAPNPFMPNMMVMRTFKRRGKGQQTNPLRKTKDDPGTSVVPMDGVAILQGAIARTEHLVAAAPPGLRDRIWLYRSRSRRAQGVTFALSQNSLQAGIQKFVARHGLLGDDGLPLAPTPNRLRKTIESKLWRLSDGDLIAVAAAIGHAPNVADQHYLSLTDEMKAEAARFVGLALPDVLRGNKTVQEVMPVSIRNTVQNTPVGRCASSLDGKHAPKNGIDHCDRFTECLTCPTYVVVGSVKDLHRLFSFQLFLRAEIEYMAAPDLAQWREHKRELIDLIDRFTIARFSRSVVDEAKSLANSAPHPFWAARMRAVSGANGGVRAR